MQNELIEQGNDEMVPVENVNREELLLRLYDGAINHVQDAVKMIDAGSVKAEDLYCLGKAYWIVEHFAESLDRDRAPELCDGLESIYDSMLTHMTEAYTEMSSEPLVPVIHALKELRSTWADAISIASGEKIAPEA